MKGPSLRRDCVGDIEAGAATNRSPRSRMCGEGFFASLRSAYSYTRWMYGPRVARLRTLLDRASTRPGGMYPAFRLATREVDDEERAAMWAMIAASPFAAAFTHWTAPLRSSKACAASLSALEPAFASVHAVLADLWERDQDPHAEPYPELRAALPASYAALLARFCEQFDSGREIFAHACGFEYFVEEVSTLFGAADERACLARGAMAWGRRAPHFAFKALSRSECLENALTHTPHGVDAAYLSESDLATLECPELLSQPAPVRPQACRSEITRVDTPPPPPPERLMPETPPRGPKISLVFPSEALPRIEPSFATASELRDALLTSYPDAAFFNAPLLGITRGRDIDTFPAWGWVSRLLRTRSDWWPSIGIALQHAVRDGGELAQKALADLLETHSTETIVLLDWTEPIADQWPDVRAPSAAAFGQPDHRLATIVSRQRALRDAQPALEVQIFDGKKGSASPARVTTEAELDSALARCARAGMPGAPDEGPWSWLASASLLHPSLAPMIPLACARFADGPHVEAMLDWFADHFDSWRYVDLLDGWSRTPPPWWNEPARRRKPRGWTRRPRWSQAHQTLGDVARAASSEAHTQAATPPIVDLPRLTKRAFA